MNQRSPTFAADIRPLFRDSDIEEMSWSFDLASYDEVRDNAEAIYEPALRWLDAVRRTMARRKSRDVPSMD